MEKTNIFFLGPAGCGKSSMTGALLDWMIHNHYNASIVNLDPGAESLPYQPDFDVREIISTKELMEEQGLGPNGAQIAAADMVAMRMHEIMEVVDEIQTPYVLFDTPGQMELFVYRNSGPHILNAVGLEKTAIAYIFDPFLSSRPEHFVSSWLLHSSVQFRMGVPMINLLGKSDMAEPEMIQNILQWMEYPETVETALLSGKNTMEKELAIDMVRSLSNMTMGRKLVKASAVNGDGLEDIYTSVQNMFFAGEDLTPE